MSYILIIWWKHSESFFMKHYRGLFLIDLVKKIDPSIKPIIINKDSYQGIRNEKIIVDDKHISYKYIKWAYFISSSWSFSQLPGLYHFIQEYNIPCNINDYSIKMRSKIFQAIHFLKHNIPHPLSKVFQSKNKFIQRLETTNTFHNSSKVVLKLPVSNGWQWVFLLDLHQKEQILKSLDHYFKEWYNKESEWILVQEFIPRSSWIDYRFVVIKGHISIIYRRYNPNDFKSNCKTGWKMGIIQPEWLNSKTYKKISKLINNIYDITHMDYFTADFMINDTLLKLCEINPVWSFYSSRFWPEATSNLIVAKKYLKDIYNIS